MQCVPQQSHGPRTYTSKQTMRFCKPAAIAAYQAMLDKVREANTHLSETDLHAKLCEARDEYVRQIRSKDN